MLEHLFVYGTLRAESEHEMALRLLTGAKLIGQGSAPGILYDLGEYPGTTFAADAKSRVIGDVFLLPEDTTLLAELDAYEGTAKEDEVYRRITIEVQLASGGFIPCWTYQLSNVPARARAIPSGDFIVHLRSRKPRAGN